RLGREIPDLGMRALEPFLQRVEGRSAEALELKRGHATGFGVVQLLAPDRHPSSAQRGRIDHGQELNHPEEAFLVLVVRRWDPEHEESIGLCRCHTLLPACLALVEALAYHLFQDRRG